MLTRSQPKIDRLDSQSKALTAALTDSRLDAMQRVSPSATPAPSCKWFGGSTEVVREYHQNEAIETYVIAVDNKDIDRLQLGVRLHENTDNREN